VSAEDEDAGADERGCGVECGLSLIAFETDGQNKKTCGNERRKARKTVHMHTNATSNGVVNCECIPL
jgi:hypothetical protein